MLEELESWCIPDGMKSDTAAVENFMAIPQEIKYQIQQFHFGVYTPQKWKQALKQMLYTHAHSGIIYTAKR